MEGDERYTEREKQRSLCLLDSLNVQLNWRRPWACRMMGRQ